MQAAADTPYVAATDLAEQLVLTGTPFREAHAIVGALVRDSLERRVPLADLVAAHPASRTPTARCSNPAWRWPGARAPAVVGQPRWCPSSSASAPSCERTRSASPPCDE